MKEKYEKKCKKKTKFEELKAFFLKKIKLKFSFIINFFKFSKKKNLDKKK